MTARLRDPTGRNFQETGISVYVGRPNSKLENSCPLYWYYRIEDTVYRERCIANLYRCGRVLVSMTLSGSYKQYYPVASIHWEFNVECVYEFISIQSHFDRRRPYRVLQGFVTNKVGSTATSHQTIPAFPQDAFECVFPGAGDG